MKSERKAISIFLCLTLSLVFCLTPDSLSARNRDRNILHLTKDDFHNFFKERKKWNQIYKDRNKKYNLWNSSFVCWNRKNRKVLIPNLDIFPADDQKFPENLAKDLEDYYKKKRKERDTRLITQDEMIIISIRNLLVENRYPFIKTVKDLCPAPEKRIKFYIFDFTVTNKMEIHYAVEDLRVGFQLNSAFMSLDDIPCIEEWEALFNSSIKEFISDSNEIKVAIPETEIKVEIKGMIGSRTILDICATNATARIKFSRNSKVYYKEIEEIDNSIPAILLRFDLSNERDIEMLNANGMWVEANNGNDRIAYNSMYSLILDFYDKTGVNFRDNMFSLLCARTSDFGRNKFGLNEETNKNIEKIELPRISSFIEEIIKKRKRLTYIQLIGYADKEGREKNNWKRWNKMLTISRAAKVKEWLETRLGEMGLTDKVKFFKPKDCGEQYYNNNDRCVDIRIF